MVCQNVTQVFIPSLGPQTHPRPTVLMMNDYLRSMKWAKQRGSVEDADIFCSGTICNDKNFHGVDDRDVDGCSDFDEKNDNVNRDGDDSSGETIYLACETQILLHTI